MMGLKIRWMHITMPSVVLNTFFLLTHTDLQETAVKIRCGYSYGTDAAIKVE